MLAGAERGRDQTSVLGPSLPFFPSVNSGATIQKQKAPPPPATRPRPISSWLHVTMRVGDSEQTVSLMSSEM